MRLIDADAMKEDLLINHNTDLMSQSLVLGSGFDIGVDYVMQFIEDAPTIEPKQGEWISLHNGKWKCSECGIEVLIYAKGNFCPNCGARMKGADDED